MPQNFSMNETNSSRARESRTRCSMSPLPAEPRASAAPSRRYSPKIVRIPASSCARVMSRSRQENTVRLPCGTASTDPAPARLDASRIALSASSAWSIPSAAASAAGSARDQHDVNALLDRPDPVAVVSFQVVLRDDGLFQLLEGAMGEPAVPHGVDQPEHLRVLMGQLRKKIEPDPAHPRYLLTEPWVGYRFADEPEEE